METLNNLYNFKNPIRHFFNLNKMKFENVESLKFKDLGWTEPIKFNIFKAENTQRTLSFPNILNFYVLLKKLEKIIGSVNSTYFKAVCSELLWEHTHDINFAKSAIINYGLELESPTEEDELTYTRMDLSICRVYSKYKTLDFDFDAFINK